MINTDILIVGIALGKIKDSEPEWVACSSVLYSSRPRTNITDDSIKKISKRDAKAAMTNLEEANVHDP